MKKNKYYVCFNWYDINGDLQYEKKGFSNKAKALKFHNHIVKTTEILINKTKKQNYNPYFNIKYVEE